MRAMTDEPDTSRKKRAAATSASYSITMRLHTDVDPAVVGRVATGIASAGGIVTALDVAESRHDRLVVDVTCSATDSEHANEIVGDVRNLEGVTVHKVSDRTFLLHIGGKSEVHSKVPLRTRDDLSMASTPGRSAGTPRTATGSSTSWRRSRPGSGGSTSRTSRRRAASRSSDGCASGWT